MKKILFVLTNHEKLGSTGRKTGFFLSEVTHPHKILTDAGFKIDFVSPKGGIVPIDGLNLEDPLNKAFMKNEKYQKQIKNTLSPNQVNCNEYIAIYFAGGHGTMWDFPDNKAIHKIAADIYAQNGIVAAVCHGPAALVNIKLSNGKYLVMDKAVTSFSNEEEKAVGLTKAVPFLLESKLVERGAQYTRAPNFQAHIVVSERLITGQNPASAKGVGRSIIKLLK